MQALKAHATDAQTIHADNASLLRQWKRWEAGETKPGDFYQPIIARTFGTVTHAMFPDESRRNPVGDVLALTGMDTLELVSRLQPQTWMTRRRTRCGCWRTRCARSTRTRLPRAC